MKPRNWRTYYWYRPPHFSSPPGADNAAAYFKWLAAERGMTPIEARQHVAKTQRPCGLISAVHTREIVPAAPLGPVKRDPLPAMIRAIGRLSHDDLAKLQTAIADRWSAIPENWMNAAD
jgi:hypothetical protein